MVSSEDVRPTKINKTETLVVEPDTASELQEAAKKLEELTTQVTGGKVLMKMERDNISFLTNRGVKFTKDAPFQAVDVEEVDELLRQNFRKAYPEEILRFYEK